jgi:hypothetical protein
VREDTPPTVSTARRSKGASDQFDVTDEEWEVLRQVAAHLRRTKFGTIALIVHDGKVKQIERAQKFRLR